MVLVRCALAATRPSQVSFFGGLYLPAWLVQEVCRGRLPHLVDTIFAVSTGDSGCPGLRNRNSSSYLCQIWAAGLLIGIECSRVRDSSWMYLTSLVTTQITVELAAVRGNYLTDGGRSMYLPAEWGPRTWEITLLGDSAMTTRRAGLRCARKGSPVDQDERLLLEARISRDLN